MNNRYRISNICAFDNANRRRGIGSLLMDTILKEASASKARMVVLEPLNALPRINHDSP